MKTTNTQIKTYLETLSEPRKEEIILLVDMIKNITGQKPQLWNDIIGFGHAHYVYQSGHQGEMPLIGLASRKTSITLYLSYDVKALLSEITLGHYKLGKGCLYIKKLSDVNLQGLQILIARALSVVKSYDFIKIIEG